MKAPPMRRGENLAAAGAVALAALALLPLPAAVRLVPAVLAVAIVAALLIRRLRAHTAGPAQRSLTQERAERIRAERERRFRR